MSYSGESLVLLSGRLIRRRPHKRCDGVRGSSGSSLDTYEKGRQFRIDST